MAEVVLTYCSTSESCIKSSSSDMVASFVENLPKGGQMCRLNLSVRLRVRGMARDAAYDCTKL